MQFGFDKSVLLVSTDFVLNSICTYGGAISTTLTLVPSSWIRKEIMKLCSAALVAQ